MIKLVFDYTLIGVWGFNVNLDDVYLKAVDVCVI